MIYKRLLELLCIITFFVIIFLVISKENFSTCTFDAYGETLPKCIKNCASNSKCNDEECKTICNKCSNKEKCKWLKSNVCSYNANGSSVMTCIDECLGPKKFLWGGGTCDYSKCKQICDRCQDTKSCVWLDTKKKNECEFIPWGDTKESCVDRCVSDDRVRWGGENCTDKKCDIICDSCKDNATCKWNDTKLNKDNYILEGAPPAQNIRCIPGANNVVVEWYVIQNDSFPITSYIIHYFKTFKPFEGIKLINVPKTDDKSNRFNIDNLQTNEHYSVSLTAINSKGKGNHSNIEEVSLKPNNVILMPEY